MSKGRIVALDYDTNYETYLCQGIKKHQQRAWRNYPGGNGTYVIGHTYLGTYLKVKIYVYDLNRCITHDIRDQILYYNKRKKLSKKLLAFLEQNVGTKVKVTVIGNDAYFDTSDLPYLIQN